MSSLLPSEPRGLRDIPRVTRANQYHRISIDAAHP
jgi:hypothetical protein